MPPRSTPRGLATRGIGQRGLRIVTLVGALLVGGVTIALLASHTVSDLILLHSLAVVLIALATYGWVMLPMRLGMMLSLSVLGILLWAWAATGARLLVVDVVALIVLIVVAGISQRRRMMRMHRLEQTLSDLGEDFYVKQQNLRITTQVHEALERKLRRYQQLQTIAEQLSRLVDLGAIAQLAVSQAFELIGKSDSCLLFLVDKDRQELGLQAAERASHVPVIRTKQGDQFDRYVLRTQRPLLVNDVLRDFRFSHAGSIERPIRSVMACPIRIGQSADGVLRLDSQEAGNYTQDDLRFLDILLDLVNAAIANARLFAQTEQLALTDGLTGLYRRQPLLDQLTREIARASRTKEPLAVLMLDLDNFKQYNDTFGHPAGDVVLKTVADVIRSTVPADGLPARYGGEEFAIILPKAGRNEAAEVAERIRKQIASTSVSAAGSGGRRVTVSAGLAVFPDDAHSALELIRRADQRLYAAKRAGKNRVGSA